MAERDRGDQPQDTTEDEAKQRRVPLRSEEARRVTRRTLTLLRPYRWRLIVAAFLLIVTNGLGLLFPLVIRTLLNTILGQRQAGLLHLVVGVLRSVSLRQAVL